MCHVWQPFVKRCERALRTCVLMCLRTCGINQLLIAKTDRRKAYWVALFALLVFDDADVYMALSMWCDCANRLSNKQVLNEVSSDGFMNIVRTMYRKFWCIIMTTLSVQCQPAYFSWPDALFIQLLTTLSCQSPELDLISYGCSATHVEWKKHSALDVVRRTHKQTNTQTGAITLHCAA